MRYPRTPAPGLIAAAAYAVLVTSVCLSLAACTPAPAQSETAASCTAELAVDSTPAGATVLVDGVARGVTPLRLNLAPGTVNLIIERDGFGSVQRSVRLSCSQASHLAVSLQDIRAPLVSLQASVGPILPSDGLKVSVSADDGAGIVRVVLLVDGQAAAESAEGTLRHNIDTRALSPGMHQLEARAWDASGLVGVSKAAFVVATPEPPTLVAPTFTPRPTLSATPVAGMSATPPPAGALTPTVGATPTPIDKVVVSRRTVDIATYAYREALYTDEAHAGHPYPLLGQGWGTVSSQSYELIVLRNAYLEVELLPELGGRIYQIRYLPTDQTLLYNNQVIKPTPWGPKDQGWWLAVGGIEFCLPVEEHGYVSAEPWEAEVIEAEDGSASVTLSLLEQTRQVEAQVTVTLRPDEAALDIDTRLTNQSGVSQSLQYWLNAMVSPGKPSVGPGLRLVLPGKQVLLHSTGQAGMPMPYEAFSWPLYQGRDLSLYRNWDNYLGFFMPTRTADFCAVYDEDTAIGLVRIFPGTVAKGLKVFGFGRNFETNLYTDDGSQYFELWGGLSRTFAEQFTLAASASVFWRETWYPIVALKGPSLANAQVALWVGQEDGRLTVQAHSVREQQAVLVVMQGSVEISRQPVVLAPTRPLHLTLGLPGKSVDDIRVLLLRPTGETIIEQTAVWAGE